MIDLLQKARMNTFILVIYNIGGLMLGVVFKNWLFILMELITVSSMIYDITLFTKAINILNEPEAPKEVV